MVARMRAVRGRWRCSLWLEEEAPEIGAESMVPDLQKVQAAAKHQLGLINDILDLAKIEAGKMTLFIEEF